MRRDHILSVHPPIHPWTLGRCERGCANREHVLKIRVKLGAECSLSHTDPCLGPWREVSRGETEAQWAVTCRDGGGVFWLVRFPPSGRCARSRGLSLTPAEGRPLNGTRATGGPGIRQHTAHPYRPLPPQPSAPDPLTKVGGARTSGLTFA